MSNADDFYLTVSVRVWWHRLVSDLQIISDDVDFCLVVFACGSWCSFVSVLQCI